MIAALILSDAQRAQLAKEARGATPRECCGLIEGVIDGETARVTALHPTRNLGTAPDRFEIDPADHIAVMKALRGTGRAIIGCYHSHPNGKPEPSPHDRDGAGEDGFVWLIQPATGTGAGEAAAYVFEGQDFRPIAIQPAD